MEMEYTVPIDEGKGGAKLKSMSFDGTTKSAEGCARDIPYWEDSAPETERVKQRVLSMASPEALAFWQAHAKAPGKVDASNMSSDEWHERRKHSIGSSAASHVTGECPYEGCTPYDLYMEKIGEEPNIPLTEEELRIRQDLFDFGHCMETYLHGWVKRRWPHSNFIVDTNIYNSEDRPYLTANLDGMMQLPDGSWVHVEFKTANKQAMHDYDNGGIPVHYKRQLIQCQHIMNVWVSYIIVCFDRDNVLIRRYERDLDTEMEQVQMMDDFWNGHVLPRIPPSLEAGNPENVLKALRKYGSLADSQAPLLVLPDTLSDDAKEINEINKKLSRLREEIRILEEQRKKRMVPIVVAMGTAVVGEVSDGTSRFRISYKPQKPKVSVDMERLENEFHSVYEQVVSVPVEGIRPFKIKEIS